MHRLAALFTIVTARSRLMGLRSDIHCAASPANEINEWRSAIDHLASMARKLAYFQLRSTARQDLAVRAG